MTQARASGVKGLRQFLEDKQQQDWLTNGTPLPDDGERAESLELRFKYLDRFEKLQRRPQAAKLFAILRLYTEQCIPIPRRTERYYWSVSCLPSSSDKPLVRVNASWMELFTLYADGNDLRARFILHLSDFTTDGSTIPDHIDQAALEECAGAPIELRFSNSGADLFVANVRGTASIRQFIETERSLHAIRNFNLTHMNRGRNAYQASHCFSLADYMLGD